MITRLLAEDYFNPIQGVTGEQITRSIVLLERAGFAVDVPLLNSKCAQAREDEAAVLRELRRDYRELRRGDSKSDEEVDAIWSSATQLQELVHDYLKLPASPIYKKGQVATWKGEIRLDGVALDYLGNEHVEYRAFLHRIRTLRTIRGSIKYLSKLPRFVSADGFIHPTYGAMGDEDDRSGTNTGRLGMKNPEGHQIPAEEEKDPYDIRSCFVAPAGQVLIVRDYSAMEVVILAYLCKLLFNDSSLYEAVKLGGKFHTKNAKAVFGDKLAWKDPSGRLISTYSMEEFTVDGTYGHKLRKDAKTVWYGAQYRKGGRGFGYTLLDSSGRPIGEKRGQDVLDGFLEEAPALNRWYNWTDRWLDLHTYMPSPGGLCRDLSSLLVEKIKWKIRSAGRKGGNHPIQAMSATIKMAAIWACLNSPLLKKLGFVMQMEVHDELIHRGKPEYAEEADAEIKKCMEETYPLEGLVTSGGIGKNWRCK